MKKFKLDARVATALIGIPLVLVVVKLGGWPFWLVVALLAVMGMRELDKALKRSDQVGGARLMSMVAYPALLGWLLYCAKPPTIWPGFGHLLLLLTVAVLLYGRGGKVSILSVAMTFMCTTYVGLFAFMYLLRQIPEKGAALFCGTILCVWASDTAAYFVGRAMGKRKVTSLSPGKTVEGVIGGAIACLITGVMWARFTGNGLSTGLMLGLIVAITAPLGDLIESFWKRELGLKDLGSVLPGHGGVLDRCDSLLFASFAVYAWASLASLT